MNIIETKNLTKYYLGRKVIGIRDLDLEVREGEIFGFIGPNGAGKTTTIRVLLDLIRPTSGNAKIFNLDCQKNSVEIKEGIGFLPGEIFLPEHLTGRSCINYYCGFKKTIDRQYLRSLIARLDFDQSKKVSDYSKGNRQKLAIILALMHKPRLLILDEPTSGLDPLNQNTFYALIKEAKSKGSTIFVSTHLLAEAQNLCDRVGIIKQGKLIKIENIDDFRQNNIREIHLETKKNIDVHTLSHKGVKEIKKTSFGYHLVTVGNNAKIIKHLAKFDFDDIKIYEPSLEELFMHYYEKK